MNTNFKVSRCSFLKRVVCRQERAAEVSIGVFFLLFLFSVYAFPQSAKLCPQSSNKKAVKLADEAESFAKSIKDYEKLKTAAEKSIEEDTTYARPQLMLGDAAYRKKDYKTMRIAYEKLIGNCPDASADAHYRLATYLYANKQYAECISYYKSFLEFGTADETKNKTAELNLFRASQYINPVPFNPKVVKGISTSDPEYLAIISADNELCFFTRRFEYKSRDALVPTSVEKFMVSENKNGQWSIGEPMPFPFNKQNSNNEGGASISIDNEHLFFTVNNKGNFDIYTSDFTTNGWSEPHSVGENVNDKRQWDSQPCIAPDGKTLYFSSYRDSVFGTSDIYKSTKKADGTWSTPIALNSIINSTGNEKCPFIHPDGRTLYFSSDSLPGMGGYDIFMSRMNDKGAWSKPVNLGYPINTENDEVGFFVSTDGRTGFFASNTINSQAGYDIYSFDIPQNLKPEKVLFLKGHLHDDKNEIPLAARIELKNVSTQEITEVEYDSLTGKFSKVLLFNDDYIMSVKRDGYAYNSQYFAKTDSALLKPTKLDLDVKELKVGEAYRLNSIFFSSDSYELNDISKKVIEDFSNYLKLHPTLKVSIHGHTDNEGLPSDNIVLSKRRAKAVYDYLLQTGISSARLTHDGFGHAKPLMSNNTEEGKAKNRRTEFVIMSK